MEKTEAMGFWLGREACRELSIDKPGDSPHPCGVVLAMMTVGLKNSLVMPHSVQSVLDNNASP